MDGREWKELLSFFFLLPFRFPILLPTKPRLYSHKSNQYIRQVLLDKITAILHLQPFSFIYWENTLNDAHMNWFYIANNSIISLNLSQKFNSVTTQFIVKAPKTAENIKYPIKNSEYFVVRQIDPSVSILYMDHGFLSSRYINHRATDMVRVRDRCEILHC